MRNILFLVATILFMSPAGAEDKAFEPLFDGTSLDGWTATPGGTWKVVDGAIVGTSPKSERRHGILLSDRQFSDFVVKAKFRLVSGDSGFYFRAGRVNSSVGVHGFQVEVDETQETGGLYETGGRAWVKRPTAEAIKSVRLKRLLRSERTPGAWVIVNHHI